MTVPVPRSPSAQEPVRVLVVDDAPAFRAAASAVVRRAPGFVVVGEAVDGEQALDRAAALSPALVLLDIHLPGRDGIGVCSELVRRVPPPQVLLLSTYAVGDLPGRALTCGALAYLPKDELRPAVLRALWDGGTRDGALTRPAGPRPG